MSETQNTEYKTTWRDEYLKWICGFANANGGSMFIGKDDSGKVVGVADAKKLLEEIPNKVKDILGIVADVNLHKTAKDNGKITNSEYQHINKTSARTAVRDLELLVNSGVLRRKGEKKGAFYELGNGVNGV